MSKQTALQAAINVFDVLNPYEKLTAQEVVNVLLEFLPKERQDIIDAWDSSTAATASDDTGEQYFTQTYNQK